MCHVSMVLVSATAFVVAKDATENETKKERKDWMVRKLEHEMPHLLQDGWW